MMNIRRNERAEKAGSFRFLHAVASAFLGSLILKTLSDADASGFSALSLSSNGRSLAKRGIWNEVCVLTRNSLMVSPLKLMCSHLRPDVSA